ncbi:MULTISPECIES: hypothetical protein [unclassified Mesorhizobium]|nr:MULTISPECIES: hypothetical protein [unclassified Mesorhizobium]
MKAIATLLAARASAISAEIRRGLGVEDFAQSDEHDHPRRR